MNTDFELGYQKFSDDFSQWLRFWEGCSPESKIVDINPDFNAGYETRTAEYFSLFQNDLPQAILA